MARMRMLDREECPERGYAQWWRAKAMTSARRTMIDDEGRPQPRTGLMALTRRILQYGVAFGST